MPATISPPGASTGAMPAESTRHSASRQVLGQVEDLGGLAGRVDRRDRLAIEQRHQKSSAPSGSSTPGNSRAPFETTLPAPSVTPSPSTLMPSIVQ